MNQNHGLSWPQPPTPYDSSRERAALERLAAAVSASGGLAVPIDPEESGADVPPALADLADELAGARVGDEFELTLLAEDRTDLGPFTLLGDPTRYYPLFETPDDAIILTLNADGVPGGVWWIDEDLDLHLVAPSLADYVDLVAVAISTLNPEESEPGQKVWQEVLGHKRSRVSVLDSVDDLGSHVEFADDGLTAHLVSDD
ncbi:MAG: hypothetical protein Q4G21_02800 [Dermabacter sp.]|nr:hypothetical protein [Dermabacter sp.]